MDEAKSKRRRYNKNKKKAWIKKVDISDIEKHLEDVRREERFGGPLEEQHDSDLLYFDVKGRNSKQDDILPANIMDDESIVSSGLKASSKPRLESLFKCYELLNGLPGAKLFSTQARRKSTAEASDILIKKLLKRPIKRKLELDQRKQKSKYSKSHFNTDIWEEKEECKSVGNTYLKDAHEHYLLCTKQKLIRPPPRTHSKPSYLPAVAVPHSGTSYNPSYKDHQELLLKAIELENLKEKKQKALRKKLDHMFLAVEDAPTIDTWFNEMGEGIFDETDYAEEKPLSTENDSTVSKHPMPEKKTKLKRKKELLQKQAENLMKATKNARIRDSKFFMINTYLKEIAKEKTKCVERKQKKQKKLLSKFYNPLKLNRFKLENELDVLLGSELTPSLRQVHSNMALIYEHFKSLQRRNILEPNGPADRKCKKKVKKVLNKKFKIDVEDYMEKLNNET